MNWNFWQKSGNAQPPASELPMATELNLIGEGEFQVMVVGEASYQDNIEQICGGKTKEGADKKVRARLFLEDSNPWDQNAVVVQIDDLQVGYLNRENAKAYRRCLEINGTPRAIGICDAKIRGGWKRGEDEGYFGVRLDI